MFTPQDLNAYLEKEYALTKKAVLTYPSDKMDFKPHEKSFSGAELLRVFGANLNLSTAIMKAEDPGDPYDEIPEITSSAQAEEVIEQWLKKLTEAISQFTAEQLEEEVEMWGMKMPRERWVLFMLSDMIHHRGQLTVYIRLAGGMVPSIYGPSADDKGDTGENS